MSKARTQPDGRTASQRLSGAWDELADVVHTIRSARITLAGIIDALPSLPAAKRTQITVAHAQARDHLCRAADNVRALQSHLDEVLANHAEQRRAQA